MRMELTLYCDGGVQGGGWLSRSFDDSETAEEHAEAMRRLSNVYVEDRAAEDEARILVTIERGDVLLHEVVPTLALRQLMKLLNLIGGAS